MTDTNDTRAETFVSARLNAECVQTYPGAMPQSLEEAYGVQDAAIRKWPEDIGGWKVGRIMGKYESELGADRLAGPVFIKQCYENTPDKVFEMPVFAKGFAAVEGEVTALIARDIPEGKTDFSREDALEYIGSLHLGVEVASSPFPEINDHGPLVTISDFGNNYGLILGAEIPDWRDMALESWEFETVINGKSVGKATATGLPGGPVESVRFLLENTARRGFPVKAGMKILTGAVTGVHQAYAGDSSVVSLLGHTISLRLTEA